MKTIKYIVYKEEKYYISQCLNVDVSSFGKTVEEATSSLKEALDLYFEDDDAGENFQIIHETLLGELQIWGIMTKLPSSAKVIKVLNQHGFFFKSQKGSHQKFTDGKRTVIVPAPRKEIPIGTLVSISRQSGINIKEFTNI